MSATPNSSAGQDRPGKNGRLPDFVVIGAMKAGTTSLQYYLSLHPEIHVAHPKEPRFFVDRPEPAGRWSRGPDWYASLFRTNRPCCGEVSPQYTQHPVHMAIAARMHGVIPDAKLIYLVREPCSRLVSQYLMLFRLGLTDLAFADYLNSNPDTYTSSCYGTQLQEFMKYYPLDRILVVESRDLRDRREECLSRIFSFLGVDPGFTCPQFRREIHVTRECAAPNRTGRRMLKSGWMRALRLRISDPVYYALRDLILATFRGPPPIAEVSPELEAEMRARLCPEVALLRKLTGQALESLGD